MRRYASIDIGSNSVLLLVVETDGDGRIDVLVDTKTSLRLATGIKPGDRLTAAAEQRLQAALDDFQSIISKLQVGQVCACATQVFRVAANGPEVAKRLSRRYGWPIRIIAGNEEAALSYLAAATGLADIAEERVVIDVGGGSTEIVHGQGAQIQLARSKPIGAVSLTDQFGLSETAGNDSQAQARSAIAAVLTAEQLSDYPGAASVLLVGGTATTLAALARPQKKFDPLALHGVELEHGWISAERERLAAMTVSERAELMPFDRERARIIVAGCLIIEHLMQALRPARIVVSNRGLRWGFLMSEFGLQTVK